MGDAATGQVQAEAAAIYEDFFVPALFDQWPARVLDGAGVGAGDRVLDVGCGTGILARTAATRVGADGHVAGVDPNDGMLTVARRSSAPVDWTEGSGEQLPFGDASFDRVVSQFALMFFPDRRAGLREMRRVLAPDGRIAVATWASLDATPGYAAMVDLLRRLFGETAAQALTSPYVLGDQDEVRQLLESEFDDVSVSAHEGTARFESIDAWVHTDIRGWTLAGSITDDQYAALLAEARQEFQRFTTDDGTVEFPAPALISTGSRRG